MTRGISDGGRPVSGESSFTCSYNARNQLDTITNPNSVSISFTYDNGGRRTQVTRPGSYIQYQYNARDWITAVLNRTSGGTTRYDATYYYQDGALWDHTGNPLKRTENLAGSTYNTTLRYDHVYRQTEETKRDSGNNVIYSLTYGYDAVGNRTTRTLGGVTITYVYDDKDKMTSASGGGQSATFGYDNNGNMTSVSGTLYGSKALVYNDENRLTSMTYGGVTDLYYYRYTGERYRARLAGTYYRYLYNGDRVLEELNDSGTMQARYTTETGSYYDTWLHLYRTSGTLNRFPMYDNIGSARGLLDASGTATDWYELDTFGRQVSSSGTTPNPYRYGAAWGYMTDPSGFLQLGARYYWPEVGRFVGRDPIEDEMNAYSYVDSDPVVLVDADGENAVYPSDPRFPMQPTHGPWGALLHLRCIQAAVRNAYAIANRHFPGTRGQMGGGPEDAYRHCVWACLVRKTCGGAAYNSGVLDHENPHARWAKGHWSNTYSPQDMANDEMGRKMSCRPGKCEDECANAYHHGQLYIMPKRYWTP
jgi:RHS repeat-associated protein